MEGRIPARTAAAVRQKVVERWVDACSLRRGLPVLLLPVEEEVYNRILRRLVEGVC
jgi:hypothetical protein